MLSTGYDSSKVYTPEITLSENNKVNMKFNGEDFGNKYFYYVDVKDLENN